MFCAQASVPFQEFRDTTQTSAPFHFFLLCSSLLSLLHLHGAAVVAGSAGGAADAGGRLTWGGQ